MDGRKHGGTPRMAWVRAVAAAGVGWVSAGAGGSWAAEPEGADAAALQALLQKMAAAGDGEDGEEEELPSLEEVTKGFSRVNHNMNKDERTLLGVYRKEDRVIAVVPEDLLNTPWLLGATLAAGPMFAGEQLGTATLEFRRRGNVLDLYEPELRFSSTPHPELAEGVKRTRTDRYISSVAILGEGSEGLAIDFTGMLLSNASTLVGSFLGSMNTSVATLAKVKAFNRNVEVAITAPVSMPWYWFSGTSDDGRLQTLHFSLSALPEDSDFPSRAADQRVGFWTHAVRDIGKRSPLGDDLIRTIERWDLKKANPDAKLSPPEKPIIFYIERTVPQAYRLYVRRGIEAWNEAFREVGIVNAIEVRQQTETLYADVDPEDVRNNFVRWVPTGFGYAIALHRTDPRTGQILDADIVIDDGWVDAWVNEYPLLVQEAAEARLTAMRRSDPSMAALAAQLEARGRRMGLLRPPVTVEREGRAPADALLPGRAGDRQRYAALRRAMMEAEPGLLRPAGARGQACQYAQELGHHMAMGRLAWAMNAMVPKDAAKDKDADKDKDGDEDKDTGDDAAPLIDGVPEGLIGDNLIALVAHEVGHVLGLRHNFAASAWKPASAVDTYTDPAQEPPVASVMDYVGTFVASPDGAQGLYNMVRVGPYDRWAIGYGYMQDDEEKLKAHLARSSEPEHHYLTDEHTSSIDPTAMTYDFGSDPVEGRERELARIDRLRGELMERLVKDGENWSKVNTAFQTLWFAEMIALWNSTGWVGGTYISRDANTDGARTPLRNVEPERQRAVLDMLVKRAFSEDSFQFDRDLLNHLQEETWYIPSFGLYPWVAGGGFNVQNSVNLLHYLLLSDLFFISTSRLIDQEMRADPSSDALTMPELHARLTEAVWSEFEAEPKGGKQFTNLKPKVGAVRRGLQREHVEQLVDLAYRYGAYLPATMRQAQLVAIDQLRTIRGRLAAWQGEDGRAAVRLDDYTRVHVRETLELIDTTLAAQVTRQP